MAIGILLVVCTFVNTICMGPTCYPIVAETPSGRLRYKTITVGRFAYNVAGVIQNSLTPRMLAPDCTLLHHPLPVFHPRPLDPSLSSVHNLHQN